jgi:4'-phosphopantetheinyl transferase
LIETRFISAYCSIAILDMELFKNASELTDKRELEKAGALYALKELLNDSSLVITYDEFRKPFVSTGVPHISISHSYTKLVVIAHQGISTGIDIEKVRDKIGLIQHKFLSEVERLACNNNMVTLTLYWAIKEAVYKAYGKKNLDFIDNIQIQAVKTSNRNSIFVNLTTDTQDKIYELQFEIMADEYVMAYVINEVE